MHKLRSSAGRNYSITMISNSEDTGETGQVYVNEKGRLYHVSEVSFQSQSSVKRRRSKVYRNCTAAETHTSLNQMSFKQPCNTEGPKSLQFLAMDFVARHIELVESLVDFPDVIGKPLFELTQKHKVFLDGSRQVRALQLFCEAYNQDVLDGLNLSGRYLALNQCLHLLLQFNSIIKLDVSRCELGDDHEFLLHIGSIPSLETLNLSENSLSDVGIRKMTTKLRVFGTGPSNLTHLNLSCNPKLSDRCVGYLLVFKYLQFLDMSGCNITHERGIAKLERQTSLVYNRSQCHIQIDKCEVKTSGWATSVITEWIHLYTQKKSTNISNHPFTQYKKMKIKTELKDLVQNQQVKKFPLLQFTSKQDDTVPNPQAENSSVSKQAENCAPSTNLGSRCHRNTVSGSELNEVIASNCKTDCHAQKSKSLCHESKGQVWERSSRKLAPVSSQCCSDDNKLDADEMALLQSYCKVNDKGSITKNTTL
ncbi:leucine-rich repeat-containing protein 42-like [Glandiceps talaboti]